MCTCAHVKLEVIESDEKWLPMEVDMRAGPGELVCLRDMDQVQAITKAYVEETLEYFTVLYVDICLLTVRTLYTYFYLK